MYEILPKINEILHKTKQERGEICTHSHNKNHLILTIIRESLLKFTL